MTASAPIRSPDKERPPPRRTVVTRRVVVSPKTETIQRESERMEFPHIHAVGSEWLHTIQMYVPKRSLSLDIVDRRNVRQNSDYEAKENPWPTFTVNPRVLQLIPEDIWSNGDVPFDPVVRQFFRARSTKRIRFEHKLWNALSLTKHHPWLYADIGLIWLSDNVMKVGCEVFGSFINISRPAAALFSSCGVFTTHGFQEVQRKDVQAVIQSSLLRDVDDSSVRLLRHKDGLFRQSSTVADIDNCRWINANCL